MSPRLHLNKHGVRVLGVAESLREGEGASVVAGIVMRGDLVIDGSLRARLTRLAYELTA